MYYQNNQNYNLPNKTGKNTMNNPYHNLFFFGKEVFVQASISYQDFLESIKNENKNLKKTSQGLKAKILDGKIVFERIRPLIGNIFKPYLYCTISEHGARSFVIKGTFKMKKATRFYISLIVALLGLLGIVLLPTLFDSTIELESRLIPVIVFFMAGFIISLVIFGKRIARSDVEWMLNRLNYLVGNTN